MLKLIKNWIRGLFADELATTQNVHQKQLDLIIEQQKLILSLGSPKEVETESRREMIQRFAITGKSMSDNLTFEILNEEFLDNSWQMVDLSKDGSGEFKSMLSSLMGAGANIGISSFATNGLYRSTATTTQKLMQLKSGGFGTAIMKEGGGISGHAGYIPVNCTVFTPLVVFQFMSMLTGQYYLHGITEQLNSIQSSLNDLISFHHNEREAKIHFTLNRVKDLSARQYFTVEDFVVVNQLKYEMSIIRHEYLLQAQQEIYKIIPKSEEERTRYEKVVDDNEINTIERFKILTAQGAQNIKSKIGKLGEQVINIQPISSVIDKVSSVTENSAKVVEQLTENVNESKYFLYTTMALKAENIYQMIKFVEFKMNLSDKNPDINRIGKISEMYEDIKVISAKDSIFDITKETCDGLKTQLNSIIDKAAANSFTNRNNIAIAKAKMNENFKTVEKYIFKKDTILSDIKNMRAYFEADKEILIDNRNNQVTVYMR